ncbi:MAG TPA: DUF748 domain-containing protein [Candidatus Binataceae bacterium]|nr:DUF748 domain-containing protein [Candidatus Binataceae bacterium]
MDGIFQAIAKWLGERFAPMRQRRWVRRVAITLLVVLMLYGLVGFFGVPYALRRILTGQVATAIHRPVTVGKISFNPYRLRLAIDQLHIGDRDPQLPFVDLGHLRVKLSWSSLLRLAPVVGQVTLTQPVFHLVRTGEQVFNFSDLIAQPSPPPRKPPARKPLRFAMSNIELTGGAIYLDDQVLKQHHTVEHIRLGVPFIANLPADVNIFVQPLLRMVVDGSPFRLDGKAKLFAHTQETIVDLSLHQLDLPRYVAYVPVKLPIKLPKGTLSALLHLHFINDVNQPHISLDGGFALDSLELHDAADAPLLSLGHLATELDQIKPLERVIHLKRIYIDALNAHLTRNADGTTNLPPIIGSAAQPSKAATPSPSSTPTPSIQPTATPTPQAAAAPVASQVQVAAPAASPTPPTPRASPGGKAPLDFALGSFELADSAIEVTDRSQPTPAVATLNAIHATLGNLRTVGESTAPYDLKANFAGGGTLAAKGGLELSHNRVTTEAMLDQVDLPALKAFAAPILNGDLAGGKLTASASVKTDFAPGAVNLHVEPASAAIDNLELHGGDPNENPLAWTRFAVAVGQLDLATHQAVINAVTADGLKLFVKRDQQGQLNLQSLIRATPQASPVAPPAPVVAARAPRRALTRVVKKPVAVLSQGASPGSSPAPGSTQQWQYRIDSVVVDKAEIHSLDERAARPVKLDVVPLDLNLKAISSDMSKPIAVEADGVVNGKGSFKIDGTAIPAPLDAKLNLATRRLDLTAVNPYLGNQFNATLAAALLTMNGQVTATNQHDHLKAAYRGDLTLGGVRLLDKLTRENFASWNSFSASHIAAEYGGDKPRIRIGGLALSKFYSRIILNSNGQLNLKDIVSSPQEAPKSLTRVSNAVPASPSPTPTPTPASAPTPGGGQAATPPPAPKPLPAEIAIGGITLQSGHVNYTDNFIQPHYTADLTAIGGKIGALSTSSKEPADVLLNGLVNGSAPLNIKGSVNPLTPLAYVNLGAKADAIELPGLSPYSTKYTGYPIVKGTLTVDVHYLLQDQNLTATNHIFIDQLTFGDKVASKDAINLPVRLAVALLKDSSGAIDLTIPVSGSLNDPQFSIGGVIWQVIKNLLVKAVTSPFSLIGAAVGGSNGGAELNYIEFAPGYAVLTPDSLNRLATIGKALTDRPSLKLDISGRVDPRVDEDGLREAKVDHLVREQQLKAGGESESGAETPLTKDDYDKYLAKVYKAAKFEKPKDLIGLTKSLPPDEMKKLLIANQKVSDEDLHQLADARANAVRAALSQKIAPSRLFILPSKLNANDIKDKGKTTRADLSLE